MLNTHPLIAVTPETHFGVNYVKNRDRFGLDGDPAARAVLLDDFCGSDGFREMAIDECSFRQEAQLDPNDPWQPLRVAMHEFGRLRNASLVGEKTPSHAFHIDSLSKAFPESRFLFLRRDPRAVVASWHRTIWSKRTSIEVAETWRRYSRAMRRAYGALPDRCLEVRYEKLVSNPTAVLESVCEFLGAEYDPGVLLYHERATPTFKGAVDNMLTFEPPTPSRINAWRETTTPSELRRIDAICGREMRKFGYERNTSAFERLPVSISLLPTLWRRRIKRKLRGR